MVDVTLIALIVVGVAIGIPIGVVAAWLMLRSKTELAVTQNVGELRESIKANQVLIEELRKQVKLSKIDNDNLQSNLTKAEKGKSSAEMKAEEKVRQMADKERLLKEAEIRLADAFKALAADALKSNNQAFLDLAKQALERELTEARGDLTLRQQAIEALLKPMKDALTKYEVQVQEIEKTRVDTYSALKEKLEGLSKAQSELRQEAQILSMSLKNPQVRGRWGEITLQRAVEVAGMCKLCDFTQQETTETEEGRKRPDMVVHLPGERNIAVDSKVPLTAYMEAMEAERPEDKESAISIHAQKVRDHMRMLGAKDYWAQFNRAPEFVVMFIPAESFFSAAIEYDPALLEDGISKKVILATPTTLIALLLTVAHTWKEHRMAENAEEIAKAGSELFDRVEMFAKHLANIHGSLEKAVKAYNDSVGSWESRVVPGGKRLKELGTVIEGRDVPQLDVIEKTLRNPPELGGQEN